MSLSKVFWNSCLKLLYNVLLTCTNFVFLLRERFRAFFALFYFSSKTATTRMKGQWNSHVSSLLGLGEGNKICTLILFVVSYSPGPIHPIGLPLMEHNTHVGSIRKFSPYGIPSLKSRILWVQLTHSRKCEYKCSYRTGV